MCDEHAKCGKQTHSSTQRLHTTFSICARVAASASVLPSAASACVIPAERAIADARRCRLLPLPSCGDVCSIARGCAPGESHAAAAASPASATSRLPRPTSLRHACAASSDERRVRGAGAGATIDCSVGIAANWEEKLLFTIFFLPSSYLGEWRRPTPSQMGAHIRRSVGGSQRTHLQRRQFQAGRAGAGGSTRQSRAGRLPRSSRCRAPSLWARRFLRDRGSTERSCCSGSDSRRAHSMKGGRRTRAM